MSESQTLSYKSTWSRRNYNFLMKNYQEREKKGIEEKKNRKSGEKTRRRQHTRSAKIH